MFISFTAILKRILRQGSLIVIDASGHRQQIGDESAPVATIKFGSRRADFAIARNPMLAIGEAYMDTSLRVVDGTIYEVLALLARNLDNIPRHSLISITARIASHIKQRNPIGKAQQNVAHHYDLSSALYDLFLDRDRQYSCAYFVHPDDSLETAQQAKKRHVASKLLLNRPGLRVLDIGSGWGGLALYLAAETGADVTGVTLSTEQHKMSETRAAAAGLADQVRFRLLDYRMETGPYDRIVSVGQFEHVGKGNYTEYFAKMYDMLADDGVALLHSCGFSDAPEPVNPFIRKYIFPGADQPSLSEVFKALEKSGLIVTDVEILRLHYAETLRHWRERFCARWEEAASLYDERFCRMWEFYLALCEVGFRYRSSMVFQMQLTKRLGTTPITRDYMADWEREAQKTRSLTYVDQ